MIYIHGAGIRTNHDSAIEAIQARPDKLGM